MRSYDITEYNKIISTNDMPLIHYVGWLIGSPSYYSVMFDKMINDIGSPDNSGFALDYPKEHELLMRHINKDPELIELQKKLNVKEHTTYA